MSTAVASPRLVQLLTVKSIAIKRSLTGYKIGLIVIIDNTICKLLCSEELRTVVSWSSSAMKDNFNAGATFLCFLPGEEEYLVPP